MNTRTKHTTVKFTAPFSLRGVDEIQPPGDYAIDEDEELIDGLSWLTYRHAAPDEDAQVDSGYGRSTAARMANW